MKNHKELRNQVEFSQVKVKNLTVTEILELMNDVSDEFLYTVLNNEIELREINNPPIIEITVGEHKMLTLNK